MKTKLLRIGLSVSVSCSLVSTSCKPHRVRTSGDGQEPHALVGQWSNDEWAKIHDVLYGGDNADLRGKLFRIQKYDGGNKIDNPLGNMDDEFLVCDIPSQLLAFTGYAVQIGLGLPEGASFESWPPNPGGKGPIISMNTGQAHFQKKLTMSREMVDEVKCILTSATCTPTPTPSETVTPTATP